MECGSHMKLALDCVVGLSLTSKWSYSLEPVQRQLLHPKKIKEINCHRMTKNAITKEMQDKK